MIVDTVKYVVLGAKESLDHFFDKAQTQGFLEFISLSQKKMVEQPLTVESLLKGIKILRKFVAKRPYQGPVDLPFAMQICERVMELKEDIEKLEEERRILHAEISRVAPFGEFSMEDIYYLERESGLKFQFFCKKVGKNGSGPCPEGLIAVGHEYDLAYFVAVGKEARGYPGMIEMRIDAPAVDLKSRLGVVEEAIYHFSVDLTDQAQYLEMLQEVLVEELNKHHLICAKRQVAYPLQNSFFSVEVWLPQNKVEALFKLTEGMSVYAEPVLIEPDDRIPTCIQNEKTGEIGEDLVNIYDTPAITDKDPSSWVLWFFALFFAVIVGDAGYGAIFLLLAFYLKSKFPVLEGQNKRMLKLFFILSCACIGWGMVVSSYFGIKIAPGSGISSISPLHALVEKKVSYHLKAKDDVYEEWVKKYPALQQAATPKEFLSGAFVTKKGENTYTLLEEFSSNIILDFTILIGVIHLALGFLRYLRRNISGLGWVIFMVGGYLYFPTLLGATSIANFTGLIDKKMAAAIGNQLIYGGIAFAMIAAFIQRGWKGCGEIANMVQVFADVLSYLRLYALSLAGAIMASTFNQEGSALGLVLGAVVIFSGHCVNLLLSFMGGVIHGLRLNFLEWYHYCFDGGGRLIRPLKKLRIKE